MTTSLPRAKVGIAFAVREKFAWALAALERIYRFSDVPFRLYFVDCGYPAPVREEVERFFAGKDNVVRIESPRFLYPNEALNLVIEKLDEEYLAIIQNDVLIQPGFFRELLSTFEEHGPDIVQPHTDELSGLESKPHRHEFTDRVIVEHRDQVQVQVPVPGASAAAKALVRRIQHFEMHALMLTARAARLVAPFPSINTREHLDLAVHAAREGLTAYVNERAIAGYVLPPIREYDIAYFDFRWDVQKARDSHYLVATRWGIREMPGAMGFIAKHREFLKPENVLRDRPSTCEADVYLETPQRAPNPATRAERPRP